MSAIVNATLDIRETLIGFSRKFQRIIPFQSLSFYPRFSERRHLSPDL
ncbi:MAG: hypothetical protein R3C26_03485 [Calditrichia bacterium]